MILPAGDGLKRRSSNPGRGSIAGVGVVSFLAVLHPVALILAAPHPVVPLLAVLILVTSSVAR